MCGGGGGQQLSCEVQNLSSPVISRGVQDPDAKMVKTDNCCNLLYLYPAGIVLEILTSFWENTWMLTKSTVNGPLVIQLLV